MRWKYSNPQIIFAKISVVLNLLATNLYFWRMPLTLRLSLSQFCFVDFVTQEKTIHRQSLPNQILLKHGFQLADPDKKSILDFAFD